MKLPSFKEEFMRNSAIVFLLILSSSAVAFLANIVLFNILGPEGFGNLKVVIYLFAFLPLIADLGINSTLTKYIAEFGRDSTKTGRLIMWFLKAKLLSFTVLVAVILLSKSYLSSYFLQDASLGYLVLAGALLAFLNFFTTFSSIALGFQKFKLFGFSQMSPAISAVLAVLLSPLGIFYTVLGWSLGPLIGNLPAMVFTAKKVKHHYDRVDTWGIFRRFSLPVFPIDLTTSLSTIIIPVLDLFFSQQLVGYYSFAFTFYVAAMLLPNALSTVLFPKFSELSGMKMHDDAKDILRRAFIYYTLIVLVGLVFVILLSEWFIGLVASSALPSLLIFKVIVSMGLIFGYNAIYANYLKGCGKIRKYAVFTLAQNILLFAVSFYLLGLAY
jgi:O-antigen/teichoic acid export membrane protein